MSWMKREAVASGILYVRRHAIRGARETPPAENASSARIPPKRVDSSRAAGTSSSKFHETVGSTRTGPAQKQRGRANDVTEGFSIALFVERRLPRSLSAASELRL